MEQSKKIIIPKSIQPFAFQFGYAVVGLIIITSVSLLFKRSRVNITIPTLVLFATGYLSLAIALKKLPEIKAYWKLEKAYLLITGIAIGICIQGIPFGLTNSSILTKDFIQNQCIHIEYLGLFFTFLVVLWEELWFRNPILNLAEKKRSQIILSIYTGFLFALLHVMNPKINLLRDGTELFLAGIMLTFAYYSSKSFWLPLGLHFGNNFCSSLIQKASLNPNEERIDTNSELMIRCAILAATIVIIYFCWPKEKI